MRFRLIHLIGAASFLLVSPMTPTMGEVEDCLKIDNDLDRLTCYDREAGFAPRVRKIEGKGNWVVQTQKSKIDDLTNIYTILSSSEHDNCRYDTGANQIGIDCRENATLLYIYFGGCFMSGHQGGGRVTYRLDSEPAATITMSESNNHDALGLWDGAASIPFVKKLFGHSKLLIRATPFSDSAVTAIYEIAGIEEAIKPLREACHW